MVVTVDVPRHDPPVARVGDSVGRAERSVPQPEPQERPLGGDIELAVPMKSSSTRSFEAVPAERRTLGRREGAAVC